MKEERETMESRRPSMEAFEAGWSMSEHKFLRGSISRREVMSSPTPARPAPAVRDGVFAKASAKTMTRVGFEPTPGYPDEKPAQAGKLSLESHALDRSAILPCPGVPFIHPYQQSCSVLEVQRH